MCLIKNAFVGKKKENFMFGFQFIFLTVQIQALLHLFTYLSCIMYSKGHTIMFESKRC
jgi:hypothetical protein